MGFIKFTKWFNIREGCNKPRKYIEQSTVGTEDVESSQVESLYAKVKDSIMLVRMYDGTLPLKQRLLTNISTIANLSGSAYGLYISSENKKVIGPEVVNKLKLIYPNDPMLGTKLQKLPKKTILDYVPDINPDKIVPSNVIHIDVKKHLQKYGDSVAAIIEIASTIAHEATHVLEFEETGETKDGPGTRVEKAESSFKNWAKTNWKQLQQKFGFQGEFPFR